MSDTPFLRPPTVAGGAVPSSSDGGQYYADNFGATGPPGPEGPEGPQGPPGEDGASGDSTYVHEQMVASATWVVEHGMGKYPVPVFVDSADDILEGVDYEYTSLNTITATFSSATGGKVILN